MDELKNWRKFQMNLFDKVKNPFEDNQNLIKILDIYCNGRVDNGTKKYRMEKNYIRELQIMDKIKKIKMIMLMNFINIYYYPI